MEVADVNSKAEPNSNSSKKNKTKVAGLIGNVLKDVTRGILDAFRRRLLLFVILSIIIFCLIFFLLLSWYQDIALWLVYALTPTEDNYNKAIAYLIFAGILTFIFAIVMILILMLV